MRKELTPQERLIVALDLDPNQGRKALKQEVLRFARELNGTGVCIKLNYVLRALGYDMVDEIHALGLSVFADLKLVDIPSTLANDGVLLNEAKVDIVTVSCSTGIKSIRKLKQALPDTEILGVTVLTTFDERECREVYLVDLEPSVNRMAYIAAAGLADGLICSPLAASRFRNHHPLMSLNTPGIRPIWATVKGDDQNQEVVMTPEMAIKAGVDRIIVGRPIVQDVHPYDAVMRTIEEIESALR